MFLRLASLRGCTMLALLLICGVCDKTVSSQSEASSAVKQHRQIVVKIRNADTGLPIWLASPYVFVGKAEPQRFRDSYRRTKLWGDAHVDVTGADPKEVRVWIDFIHRDCRFPDGQYRTFDFGGTTLNGIGAYNLDTILATGVVAPNLCSGRTERPEPGVLTIYVIPATFKELWNS